MHISVNDPPNGRIMCALVTVFAAADALFILENRRQGIVVNNL
jgi:hypothetical protein